MSITRAVAIFIKSNLKNKAIAHSRRPFRFQTKPLSFFPLAPTNTMDVKAARHTSMDLEDLQEKIANLLKDPAEALDYAPVDVDSMSLAELKEFAERGTGLPKVVNVARMVCCNFTATGGLGSCVSKADVLANTPQDLMYLSGIYIYTYIRFTLTCLFTDIDAILFQGERIVVLKHIKDDIYMVTCKKSRVSMVKEMTKREIRVTARA